VEPISGTSSESAVIRKQLGRGRPRWIGIAVLAAVILVAAAAAYLAGRNRVSSVTDATYRQLTFDPGYTGPARFTRDGNTAIYSASRNGGPRQLYAHRMNGMQSTSLNVNADVMGTADNGDMALILNRHFLASWLQRGTLARMSLDGGAPRPILEDVYDADITRDGKEFAVVRRDGEIERLEFPIGKVLFRTPGWISDVRISPDASHVAFIHHPITPDDSGEVALVDRQASVKSLTATYPTARGLCWTPDGNELWYTASQTGYDTDLQAVTLRGKIRIIMHTPIELDVQDFSAAGKALVESVRFQVEVGVKRMGADRPRDLENSVDVGAISPSGDSIVFNRPEGPDYQAYAQRTDGAAEVKLGEGFGSGFSWDDSMVLSGRRSEPHKLFLYPTGAGEQKVFDLAELTPAFGIWVNGVTFSRDGQWALFSAFNSKQEVRDYLLDLRNGKLRPATPAGTRAGKLSPDATRVVTLDVASQKYILVDLASGKASNAPGIQNDEEVLTWNPDGSAVVVWNLEFPAEVTLVNVTTGKRQRVQTVEPLTMSGSMFARIVASADGKTVAYCQRRALCAIYAADGLR